LDPRAPALASLPRPPADATPAAAELARHEQLYRAVTLDPHPALELALRWLAAAPPAPRAETLVHGDFRIGNVIFGPEGLRAVLDWELAHAGDPMEDLGWLWLRPCRFGAPAQGAPRWPRCGGGCRSRRRAGSLSGGGWQVSAAARASGPRGSRLLARRCARGRRPWPIASAAATRTPARSGTRSAPTCGRRW